MGTLVAGLLLTSVSDAGAQSAEPGGSETPSTAPAEPDDALGDVEVIRVKGRGLDAIQTEVPTSVAQFDADEIAALGAQDISDLAKVTPNVEIVTVSATAPTFFIRGVGLNDFNANAPGSVAVYQDGVPLNAPAIQLGQLFDVQDVQILRGPQGWGDERNASGGAIKVTSRRPDGQLGASVRADYGNYAFKDIEAALSAPIVDEILSTRLSFRFTERDGYITNGCGDKMDVRRGNRPPNPDQIVCNEDNRRGGDVFIQPGLPTRVQDVGSWAARGQLLLQPPETDMEFLLNAHGGRIDHFSPLGQVIGTRRSAQGPRTVFGYIDPPLRDVYTSIRTSPQVNDLPISATAKTVVANNLTMDAVTRDIGKLDVYENDYDLVGSESLDSVGSSLRADIPLGPVRITSITGGERYWRSRVTDFDMSSNPSIQVSVDDDAYQITQNLAVGSELADVPFAWEAGGFYLGESLAASSIFDLRTSFIAVPLFQDYQQEFDSFGIFGNFRWDFTDSLSLEGGVRYNWENKRFDLSLLAPGRGEVIPTSEQQIWSAPTGGLSLSYRFNDDVSIYGKYTRGWKTGHFNASVTALQQDGMDLAVADITTADPETIDAFEVGLRGRWLDGRLGLGAALFYYKYVDYQVFVLANRPGSAPQLEVINANDAEVYGAELDLRAEPLSGWVPPPFDGLVVTARAGWLESQFLDFTDQRGVLIQVDNVQIPIDVIVDFTGNPLPNSPRFKVSGAVEYTFDFGRWGALIPRYDFSWTDDIFFDPSGGRGVRSTAPGQSVQTFGRYAIGQPAYWLHNARLGYRTGVGNIEIAGWVRNITNEVYKTYAADATVNFFSLLNWVGEPRTYGGSISIYY